MSRPAVRPDWPGRLVYALTGEPLGAPATGPEDDVQGGVGRADVDLADVDPADVDPVGRARARLVATGWDDARLHDHARGCREAGRPWPHPLPPDWLGPGEHARYQALLHELVVALAPARGPAPGGPAPDPRDRALMADRPPHW